MRIIAFISIVFLSTLLPWYVLLLLAIGYSMYWSAYELLFLAVGIDAYFGVEFVLPYYTVTTFCLLVAIEWVKPRLLLYNT